MKLIIDRGNTATKIALFNDKKLYRTAVIKECSLENVLNFVEDKHVSATILSSVKENNANIDDIIIHFNALSFDYKTVLPIKVNYKTPETLGVDRIGAVVGASLLFPDKDVLVIDAGTSLTIDFITKDRVYKGGRISLGIEMRYKALNLFTDRLPLCTISKDSMLIGLDTESSIISGVQKGVISEITDVINIYKQHNKDTVVAVTGGDCFFFEKELKNSIFADPFLLMKGLNEILDYNE